MNLNQMKLTHEEHTARVLLDNNQLPSGPYGVQLGDYDTLTNKIVWGGAQWNLGTTEETAQDLANAWRKDSVRKTRDMILEKISDRNPLYEVHPLGFPIKVKQFVALYKHQYEELIWEAERTAPVYRPIRLGQ